MPPDWLKLFPPEIREAIIKHRVLALLLTFLLILWTIALPTKTAPLDWIIVLSLVVIIVGLLFEFISNKQVPASHFKAVLFDEAHGQDEWLYIPPTIGRGYKRIAELTTQQYNLQVEVLKKGEAISLEKLGKYAAFVLIIGPKGLCSLEKDELEAIMNYVGQGHGVLILSTYTGDWHHEANLNKLAENYGMVFNNDVVLPKDAVSQDASGQHFEDEPDSKYAILAQPVEDEGIQDAIKKQLLEGVRQIKTLSSCSLTVTNTATTVLCSEIGSTIFEPEPLGRGIAIARYREKEKGSVPLIAASKNGKVISIGGWKIFLDKFVDDPNYDNRRLYENILRWLVTTR